MAQDPTYCANPLEKAKYWVRFEEQNRKWTFANWTVSRTKSRNHVSSELGLIDNSDRHS
jgi:hypothetical protein